MISPFCKFCGRSRDDLQEPLLQGPAADSAPAPPLTTFSSPRCLQPLLFARLPSVSRKPQGYLQVCVKACRPYGHFYGIHEIHLTRLD